LRAYERLKHDGKEQSLLEHAPAVQNQALRGTSSWANYWLGRDHAAKRLDKTLPDKTEEKKTTETKPSPHGSTH
jgi:methylenetetrahydrofolate reductase (NADPH)